MMWWLVLFIGFSITATQTFFYQTFNGASLVGLMIVLLASGFILTKEIDR